MNTLQNRDIELISFLKEVDSDTIRKKADENGVTYLAHVFRLYEKLFGEVCTGCPAKIPQYINRIKNYKIMADTKKAEPKYRLKEGVIIPVKGSSKVYSEHNITDKIAAQLLEENPNRAVLFDVKPEPKGSSKTPVKETGGKDTKQAKPGK